MADHGLRRRQFAPTCEEVNDDFDDDFVDDRYEARARAHGAANPSQPELQRRGSYERRRTADCDSGYASRAGTAESGRSGLLEKKAPDLKLDTAFPDRESRPYRYSSVKADPRQSSARPVTQPKDTSVPRDPVYKHRDGVCAVCDKYGRHIDPPKRAPAPPSPIATRRPETEREEYNDRPREAKPRPRRTSSHQHPRPVSMYASLAPNTIFQSFTPIHTLYQEPSYAATTWQAASPAAPLATQYPSVVYPQYTMTAASPVLPPEDASSTLYRIPNRSSPPQPSRRLSMYGQSDRPVIQQRSQTLGGKPVQPPEPYSDSRHVSRAQKSSRDEELDRQAMPPPPPPPPPPQHPPQTLVARRLSAPHHRRSQSYEDDRPSNGVERVQPSRERRADATLPPSSYKGPSTASPYDRTSPKKQPSSHDNHKRSDHPSAPSTHPAPTITRRLTSPPIERHEAEAEAYQRRHGTTLSETHSLTAEALKRVPKQPPLSTRSETNSSQMSRNSSSKDSSGAKTGNSATTGTGASDITLTINGIALEIPKTAQRITIQGKAVNISVGGNSKKDNGKEHRASRTDRPENGQERTTSDASKASWASKTSSGREKEIMRGRIPLPEERERYGDREFGETGLWDQDRAGRRSQSTAPRSRSVSRYRVVEREDGSTVYD